MGRRPPRSRRAARRSSSADFVSATHAVPCSRTAGRSTARPRLSGIDDVESRLGEQALGQRRAACPVHRARAARPCCARRNSGNRRSARRRRHRRAAGGREMRPARGQRGRPLGQRGRRRAPRRPSSAPFMTRVPTSPCIDVGRAEPDAHAGGDCAVVAADDVGDAMRERAGAPAAQRLDQQAGLDADRARGRAQPAGGAGVDARGSRRARAMRRQVPPSSPLGSRRAISRQPTIRCRGDSVSPRDGHFGSQKPHSMHLSTSGVGTRAAASGAQVRPAGRR